MKATELMIGDWVMTPHGYPSRVQVINDFGCLPFKDERIAGWVKYFTLEEVEPIPLTKEILEKSGFHYGYTTDEEDIAANTIAQLSEEDKGWVWDEGDGAIKVIFPNNTDGGMIFIDDQSFDKHMTFCFAEMIFVHQLQQAMRICGITKSIEV